MQWVVHTGAHSTDEGQLFKSLLANSDLLRKRDVVIPAPRRYRMLFRDMFEALEVAPPSADARDTLLEAILDGQSADRVVLSNVNFFGTQWSAIRDRMLYPLAGPRLAQLSDIFQGDRIELFMGLRDPGSFIPKVLMALPLARREEILDVTDLSALSWAGMIEEIRNLAPNVAITVWSNEDTPLIWGDILRAMGGLSATTPLREEYALLSRLLTEPGKAALRDQLGTSAQSLPHPDATAISAIFAQHVQPELADEEVDMPGWTAEIIDAFAELYRADMAEIRAMPGVRVLEPAPGSR